MKEYKVRGKIQKLANNANTLIDWCLASFHLLRLTAMVDDSLRSGPENQPFYVLASDKKDHGVF